MELVISVEGIDRPGLLRDVASALSSNDADIIYNVAYGEEGKGYLLFIARYEGDVEALEDAVMSIKDVDSVESAPLGAEAADIIAEYVEVNPAISGSIAKLMHPSDFIEVIARLDVDARRKVYLVMPKNFIGALLAEAPHEILDEVSTVLKPRDLAEALASLDPDDLVDVLQGLKSSVRKAVLKNLPKAKVDEVRPLLLYPPETAGGLMTTKVPQYLPSTPVSKVIEDLSTRADYEITDTVYVVDEDGRLLGYVNVLALFKVAPKLPISKLARKDYVAVEPLTDQEEVSRMMIKFDITKVPVVDEGGRFLGVVTIDDVMDVLISEESEDLLLLGGVMRVEHYLTARITSLFKKRLVWLLVLCLMENVTARIISGYTGFISRVAILAAFIPLILDTGGNAGNQSVVLVTRALALGELTIRDVTRVIAKEFMTSALLAFTLSPVAFLFAYGVSFNLMVSLSVSIAVALVVLAASVIGALLPLVAVVFRIDPAVISAPLITTVTDIVGLILYFIVASLILGIAEL